MSLNRRGFLGFLGLGAVAAGAASIPAKALAGAKDVLPESLLTEVSTPEALVPHQGAHLDPTTDYPHILRLVHGNSHWARRGQAEAGDWITHAWRSKQCVSHGRRLRCIGFRHLGDVAFHFHELEAGTVTDKYTDPDSPEFKEVVQKAGESRVPYGVSHYAWGPRYSITLVGIGAVEFTGLNRSNRGFMRQAMGKRTSCDAFTLVSQKVVHSTGGTWFKPTMEFIDSNESKLWTPSLTQRVGKSQISKFANMSSTQFESMYRDDRDMR